MTNSLPYKAKVECNQSGFLYSYNYSPFDSELCKLESRHLFDKEENNKLLFSNKEIVPSCSAFIKKRLEILCSSNDYKLLLDAIEKQKISCEGFKVSYDVLEGDLTEYANRLKMLKDIGYRIEGNPDYYKPTTTYALSYFSGNWYFGIQVKNDFDWHKHKHKPRSYSNSITVNIAKTLVNVASKSEKEKKLLDACCGVGTILLEACFAGYNIEGCDINWKVCRHSRENLAYFNYEALVHRSDIKDLAQTYDAAIIDLPYNLYTSATDNQIINIVESASAITDRLVIVSTIDMLALIKSINFKLVDYCSVQKEGKGNFRRKIWVCEKKQ